MTGGHGGDGHGSEGCCNAKQQPRSHDTSQIAWAKLMARMGEEFPLECPACGGDIQRIALTTEPGPIRKILTHLADARAAPPEAHESLISPKTVAVVPFTGLSLSNRSGATKPSLTKPLFSRVANGTRTRDPRYHKPATVRFRKLRQLA